jgi:hypothetical protein
MIEQERFRSTTIHMHTLRFSFAIATPPLGRWLLRVDDMKPGLSGGEPLNAVAEP